MDSRRIFNEQAIGEWKADLESIPERMDYWANTKLPHQFKLAELKPELANIEIHQIAPTNVKLEGLQAQIEVLKIPSLIASLQQESDPHQNQINHLERELQDVMAKLMPVKIRLAELNALIAIKEAKQTIDTLTPQMRAHQSQIIFLQPQFASLNLAIQSNQRQLTDLRQKLYCLEGEDIADRARHEHRRSQLRRQYGLQYERNYKVSAIEISQDLGEFEEDVFRTSEINRLRNECQILLQQYTNQSAQQHNFQVEICQHQQEIASAQNKIAYSASQLNCYDRHQKEIAQHEGFISLRERLAVCVDEKIPLENQKNIIKASLNNHMQLKNTIQNQIEELQQKLNTNKLLAQPFADNNSIQDLHEKLKKEKNIQRNFQAEKERLKREISHHMSEIGKAEFHLQEIELQNTSLRSNHFLMKLRYYPADLVEELAQNLVTHLEAYDKENPAKQSVEVRICLAELNEKIAIIRHRPLENGSLDMVDFMRLKYYQLIGFSQNMLQKLETNPGNRKFAEKIGLALGSDLLDPMIALSEYNKLSLHEMSEQELDVKENFAFDTAKREFNTALEYAKEKGFLDLHKTGIILSEAVGNKKNKKSGSAVDTKYLINTLNRAQALACTPTNKNLQKNFKNLISYNQEGRPSRGKLFVGALKIFLGATIVAVCAAAKITTFFVSAPLTTPGLIVGSAMLLAGLGVFRWGMRRGFSKQMVNYHKAAEAGKKSPVIAKSPLLFSTYPKEARVVYPEFHPPGGVMPRPSAPSL